VAASKLQPEQQHPKGTVEEDRAIRYSWRLGSFLAEFAFGGIPFGITYIVYSFSALPLAIHFHAKQMVGYKPVGALNE